MQEKDIENLISDLQTKLKKRRGVLKPEDFSANYQTALNIKQQIDVHCKANNFPDALMKAKAPNETMQELQYRKDIFEPITKPYWDRALATLNRIWAEQNYSINWNDSELEDYFTRDFPVYKSILTYFKTILTHYKINDPNALMIVDVGEIPTIENEDAGTLIADQSEALSPVIKIIGSDKVLYFDMDEYAFFLGDDNSVVIGRNGKPERTGLVFYCLDQNNLWRISQKGAKSDYLFDIRLVYEHNLSFLPAKRLGGKTLTGSQDDDIIYESYFMAAIPNLNKALKIDSTLDISFNRMGYPIRVYYEEPCGNPMCKGGKVAVYDPANVDAMQDTPTEAMLKDCPDCGGTGRAMGFGPMRDYIHTPRKGFTAEQNAQVTFPGFQYVSPDPAILSFAEDKITSEVGKAFTFLNIDVAGRNKTGGNALDVKTATQSVINREELFSFLLILATELFADLKFAIDTIIQLRYPTQKKELPKVSPPMTFEIRNLDELTAEIQSAQMNNAPDAVVRELLKEYVTLRFATAKGLDLVLKAAFFCDPLITKSDANIALLKAQNLISPLDAVMHVHIFYFLEQQLALNPQYFQTTPEAIKTDMLKMAQDKLKELAPVNTATKP